MIVACASLVACLPAGELVSTATPLPTLTETPTATVTARPTPSATHSPTVTPTVPTLVVYSVQPGDTLSEVAAFFGVSVASIAEANGLGDVHFLSLGQELIIPLPGFDPDQPGLRLTPQPAASSHLCSGLDVFAAAEAVRHVDEFACVEFRVASAQDADDAVLLVSLAESEAVFVVVVEPEWQDCWSEGPERRFEDRAIRVRGTIEKKREVPQVTIGDCSQIELVPSFGR